MKTHSILISICLISLIGTLCAIPLRLHYTNDTHGAYLPRSYSDERGKQLLGGYIEAEEVLNKSRSEAIRSIYLDAGDQQTGSAFAGLKYNQAIGGAVIEVFNMLGVNAACLGNHEFDISFANTLRLMEMAKYPFITTNVIYKESRQPLEKPYHIIKLDSLKIGVLGLTLMELPDKVKASNVESIEILPYRQAIMEVLDEVDAQTDLIVILTHNGLEADIELAKGLDHRVDIIIGGHSHSILSQPKVVNDILILQSGSYLQYLGALDLDVKEDRIASFSNQLIPVQVRLKPASTDLSRFVDRLRAEIDHSLNRIVGNIPIDWVPDKYAETEVSRWQADALVKEYQEIYHVDLAMINCGGIRKAVAKGPISLKDLSEMLPFNNTITVFSCSGTELMGFYERHTQKVENRPFDMVQPSAMRYEINAEGQKTLYLYDQIVEPQKTYRVVSHDYLVGQWQKYLGFAPQDVYDTGDLLLDAIVKQVIKQYGK